MNHGNFGIYQTMQQTIKMRQILIFLQKAIRGLFTVFCHSIIAHFQEGVYYMSRNILAKYKTKKKMF